MDLGGQIFPLKAQTPRLGRRGSSRLFVELSKPSQEFWPKIAQNSLCKTSSPKPHSQSHDLHIQKRAGALSFKGNSPRNSVWRGPRGSSSHQEHPHPAQGNLGAAAEQSLNHSQDRCETSLEPREGFWGVRGQHWHPWNKHQAQERLLKGTLAAVCLNARNALPITWGFIDFLCTQEQEKKHQTCTQQAREKK